MRRNRRSIRLTPGRSNNRSAIEGMIHICAAHGKTRLVIVGGSANAIKQTTSLINGRIQIRHINGLRDIARSSAHAHTDWADMIAIWETTPLHHSVSLQFTNDRAAADKIIRIRRRSVEALATTITVRNHTADRQLMTPAGKARENAQSGRPLVGSMSGEERPRCCRPADAGAGGGAGYPRLSQRRSRNPDARATGRATAARIVASRPTSTRRSCARVTAV